VYRLLYGKLAPQGRRSRLTVLIYHRVLDEHDPMRPSEPTRAQFETRMAWVKAHFNVLPLREAIARLKSDRLPARPLSITFDDGYADNYRHALPVLQRLGLTATFFIATGYLDGGCMFNDIVIESLRRATGDALDLADLRLGSYRLASTADRLAAVGDILEHIKYLAVTQRAEIANQIAQRTGAAVPTNLMMTSAQVAALRKAGMEVGAHTVMHPILARVDLDAARNEISTGRAQLEKIIGGQVALFAYPNGRAMRDYSIEHVELVSALGFEAAVSTEWGSARHGADVFQIPRFTPWDDQPWKFGLRIARTMALNSYAMA
jgi:peptidoglycan/xylan/chitin deacetylase (PgdA/CDA1 family)